MLHLFRWDAERRKSHTGVSHVSTDRVVYKPGEFVLISALHLDAFTNRPFSWLDRLTWLHTELTIKAPDGTVRFLFFLFTPVSCSIHSAVCRGVPSPDIIPIGTLPVAFTNCVYIDWSFDVALF